MKLTHYNNILEPLATRVTTAPDGLALIFVDEAGERQPLSAQALQTGAQRWQAALRRLGVGETDIVLLVLGHSLALIHAFLGAMRLGALPSIYTVPTGRMDPELYGRQVRELVVQADIQAVIVQAGLQMTLTALLAGTDCQIISSDEVDITLDPADLPASISARPNQAAFLQFSSGTTGAKKGVVIHHAAILDQARATIERLDTNEDTVVVSWLPLHHDMGLITGLLQPMIYGVPTILLSPTYWIRKPQSMLWAVSDYGGTHSWMPNFAFNHLLRVRPADIEGVNLSSWRQILNGAEAIRYDSLQAFAERYAPYGLAPEALTTGYGMAENTLAISLKPLSEPIRVDWVDRAELQTAQIARPAAPSASGALVLVSSGRPIPGTKVRIADSEGRPLPARHIGEILLQGDSLFAGYYRAPELTAACFDGDWFKTGDLGYIADGHLFVTGRKKDLIIVGGQNIYPEDIEHIANQTAGIYTGRSVAFGVFNAHLGTEGIVLVCEVKERLTPAAAQALVAELRRRVLKALGVALADVRLFDARWVVKSSSGKLARPINRAKYEQLRAEEAG